LKKKQLRDLQVRVIFDTSAAFKPRPLGRRKENPLSIPSTALRMVRRRMVSLPNHNPEQTPRLKPLGVSNGLIKR